jgi:cytochrome P450
VQELKDSYPVNDAFDPLSEDYLADPYPYYTRFRREAPVFFAPKINMWIVSRYEDILAIVKDPETFSKCQGARASSGIGAGGGKAPEGWCAGNADDFERRSAEA